jgi:hypothetical protein
MPKPGMTGITLKDDVAELLRKRAIAAGQGLNDFVTSMLMTSSLVPSPQCSQDRPKVSSPLEQTQNQAPDPNGPQNDPQTPFSLSEGSLFAKRESSVVGLPGFGPGSRAPEAHSLDQASRQPLWSSFIWERL